MFLHNDFNSNNGTIHLNLLMEGTMKLTLKSFFTLSALVATVIAPVLLSAGGASAQPKGTDANYFGAGVSAGVTNGGENADAATLGGSLSGRLTTPQVPVSVRGSVLFTDETSAIIPTISYDLPVAKNTNLYVGAGYSFVQESGKPTPLGNQNAPVVTVGAETQVGQNIVIYGDSKLGINAYEDSSASAVSFQAGAGFKF